MIAIPYEMAYMLGSELWEEDFDTLLNLVKEFVVAV